MKNADRPAMPNDIDAQTFGDLYSSNFKELEKYRSGLTKREMMAMHIAAGFAADGQIATDNVVKWSVKAADKLLQELDSTSK